MNLISHLLLLTPYSLLLTLILDLCHEGDKFHDKPLCFAWQVQLRVKLLRQNLLFIPKTEKLQQPAKRTAKAFLTSIRQIKLEKFSVFVKLFLACFSRRLLKPLFAVFIQ